MEVLASGYKLTLICIFMWMVQGNEGARILGIFPTPAFSHQLPFQTIMKALAARGHQITVITPNPLKETIYNYTEIDVSFSYTLYRSEFDLANWDKVGMYDMVFRMMPVLVKIAEEQLSSPQVQEFIKISANMTYDLVFLETLVFQSYHGLIHHLGSPPVIGILSYECMVTATYATGIPDIPSYYPDTLTEFTDHMTFYERLQNTLFWLFLRYQLYGRNFKMQESIMRKHFGAAPPSIYEAEKNMSLFMIARSPIFNYPLPLPPAVVTFHSLHVKTTPDALPDDLQKFLDEATDGVIYFSLGTNVLGYRMSEEKRRIFIDAFSELPQKVLWKWESDTLPGKPPNVRISKWLPQQDILAHRNIRLFITQCGLQSLQEAVYHNVPLLGIPFIGDQRYNAKKIQQTGLGLVQSFADMTKESLLQTINEILSNISFRENARKLSAILRDESESSLERTVWWTEYVLRHKGAKHLRSAALDLEWYQYLLLDVAAFLIITIFIILTILYNVIKRVYCSFIATFEIKYKKS